VSKSVRPVSAISSGAPVTQILAALDRALNYEGPAITICSPDAPFPELFAPPEIALVVVTSGSTGNPRRVALTGAALRASARATHRFLGAEKGQRWVLRLPLTHIAGAMVLVRSLELESVPLVDESPESPYFESIVPTQIHRAITRDATLLKSLQKAKAVLVGGAPLSEELMNKSKALGINVITTYGMSETAGGCFYNNEPLQGVKVRINRESRIEIAGPMLASGYLGDIGLLEPSESFQDGWFKTTDLGHLDADTKLQILGRSDDVIVTGGMKVSLFEVEEIIRAYPGVADVLCSARPDEEWGQRIIAGIVADSRLPLADLRDFVGTKIGRYAAPRAIVWLQAIPMRGIGKPDRGALATMEPDEEI